LSSRNISKFDELLPLLELEKKETGVRILLEKEDNNDEVVRRRELERKRALRPIAMSLCAEKQCGCDRVEVGETEIELRPRQREKEESRQDNKEGKKGAKNIVRDGHAVSGDGVREVLFRE
jgi:hypothetical protein